MKKKSSSFAILENYITLSIRYDFLITKFESEIRLEETSKPADSSLLLLLPLTINVTYTCRFRNKVRLKYIEAEYKVYTGL